MKKGFTLLELIIVVIILGVLATLGLTQYGRAIERSRGAEPKTILGSIRTFAAAHFMEYGTLGTIGTGSGSSDFSYARATIGTNLDQIPGTALANCRASHYFWYTISGTSPSITMVATRCTASGKTPNFTAGTAGSVTLVSDVSSGVDTWSSTGGY